MQPVICRYAGRTRPRLVPKSGGSFLFLRSRCLGTRSKSSFAPSLLEVDSIYKREEALRRIGKQRSLTWPWSIFLGEEEEATKKEVKQKKYILPMFPYPSGDLHLGHLRVYTISDVLARFHRMQGYDVMHPIGWDAFGLPAENAAIERGIDPATWTQTNIEKMRSQLEAMNGNWDWDKEFATCDPKFYKHTQQLFLLLHKAGLAYQAESLVNYDPVDKTVLANEQVDANGCSWRSGAKVEQKMLKQWFFKITHFRQELLEGLEILEKNGAWPDRVLAMQKNWLGKSTGAKVKFPLLTYDQQTQSDIEVFTTRPDTLFGVQYLALAATHPIVQSLAKTDVELQAFLDTIQGLPQDSKVGYLLPHVRALNPLAYEESTPDATKTSLPIYVASYVLGDYGDGAVMGVPGHDVRDHAFWKHNCYDDPVRMVISQSPDESTSVLTTAPYVRHGHLTKHSGPYAGLNTSQATKKIISLLETKGLGSATETWRLRDWLVSRQRYWGTPIPIIHCKDCGPVPVPEDQLPVELPVVTNHWNNGETGNPLDHAHEWVNTKCPECGGAANRDTDTMDTFVDSSWYFMRFPNADNKDAMFSSEAANANLPVDIYIGGVEHAILHLLYARFISKFMSTTSYWPNGAQFAGEPFKKVLTQGMVHGKTYSDPSTSRFLKPNEVDLSDMSRPMIAASGEQAQVSFEKMSKSKHNGVDPGTCMSKYGADATRAHILFQAPVSEVLEWDEERIAGINRWLKRLLEFIERHANRHRPWSVLEVAHPFNPKSYFMHRAEEVEMVKSGKLPVFKIEKLLALRKTPEMYSDFLANLKRGNTVPNLANLADPVELEEAFEAEKALWRMVQATITSVTESYSTTYSLNTVVSDLMSLTNAILDRQVERDGTWDLRSESQLIHHSVMALLKMMAPVTPAIAEFCWKEVSKRQVRLIDYYFTEAATKWCNLMTPRVSGLRFHHQNPTSLSGPGSIFDQPFPTTDGTHDMLEPAVQTCAVQINGRFRAAVEIPHTPDGIAGEKLQKWLMDEILKTEIGKQKLMGFGAKGKPQVDIRTAKRAIVIKGGKTVNFIV